MNPSTRAVPLLVAGLGLALGLWWWTTQAPSPVGSPPIPPPAVDAVTGMDERDVAPAPVTDRVRDRVEPSATMSSAEAAAILRALEFELRPRDTAAAATSADGDTRTFELELRHAESNRRLNPLGVPLTTEDRAFACDVLARFAAAAARARTAVEQARAEALRESARAGRSVRFGDARVPGEAAREPRRSTYEEDMAGLARRFGANGRDWISCNVSTREGRFILYASRLDAPAYFSAVAALSQLDEHRRGWLETFLRQRGREVPVDLR